MGRDLRYKEITSDDDRECIECDWMITYDDICTEYADCSRYNDFIPSGRFTKKDLIDQIREIMTFDYTPDDADIEEAIEAVRVIAYLIKEVPYGGWLVIDYS